MKNIEANDPLNEKDFNDQQPETKNSEPLKEEKKKRDETTAPDPSTQKKDPPSSGENAVPEPAQDSTEEPTSESIPEPVAEPSAEPVQESDEEPSPEPDSESDAETTPEPDPESDAETTPDPNSEAASKETSESTTEPVLEKGSEPAKASTGEPAAEQGSEPSAISDEVSSKSEEVTDESPEPKKSPKKAKPSKAEKPDPSETEKPDPSESEKADPSESEKPDPSEAEKADPTEAEKADPTEAEKADPTEAEKADPTETLDDGQKPTDGEQPKTVNADTTKSPEDKPLSSEDKSKSPEDKPESTKDSSKGPQDEVLIDDHEEQMINEFYDDVDLDEHDEHDEDDDHKKHVDHESHEQRQEEERINYNLLSKTDLVKLLREKLDNPGKGNIRKEVEEIKRAFYDKINAALEEKKKHFLEEGGELEDFKPAEEPVELEMKELLYKYRGLKAEFTKQLEKTKQENLQKKQEILEQFRILMEGQETFEITFRRFKDLQKQWFAAGIVPQQNLKDLWDSYNYFVEKFNDYVRINRDLRALDLKKNLELKEQLCERTEELDKEPNVVQAFKALQKHHARWREIGPVPRENRDEIWDRFKQATSVINRKHQEYHSKLKESLFDNLRRKTELCEKVESIAAVDYETHGAWVEKTNVVLEVQKTWKTIGYAPKKDNNAIYARFRKACDTFFGSKARFYAAAYEEQKDNLKLKMEITEKAEALSDSQDWKETTTELIRLQKQWKEIGPVPRRDSDKLWKRFRAACDTFFNNKSKYFEDVDSTFEDNLKAKEALVKEMDDFKPSDDQKGNLKALEEFQQKFNEIGYVPSSKKEWIKEQFRLAQDRLLERMGMSESERSIYKFQNRIRGMISAPRSEMKLNFERDKLVNKLQQLKNDIGVWENNIGFFKQSDSSEETIQGFTEKIEAAHERIRVLEEKIRILDDMENAN